MPLELLIIPAIIFGILGFVRGVSAYKRVRNKS